MEAHPNRGLYQPKVCFPMRLFLHSRIYIICEYAIKRFSKIDYSRGKPCSPSMKCCLRVTAYVLAHSSSHQVSQDKPRFLRRKLQCKICRLLRLSAASTEEESSPKSILQKKNCRKKLFIIFTFRKSLI